MAMEFSLDEVMLALCSENPIERIANSMNVIQGFYYYSKPENIQHITDRVISAEEDEKEAYLKGLITLYPLSASIIRKIMLDTEIEEMCDDIAVWFDVAETMERSFNKFITMCSREENFAAKSGELAEKIKDFNDQKQKYSREIDKLNSLKTENSQLSREVQQLREQCEALKNKYSRDSLEKEKKKYIDEIAEYKNNEATAEKELKELYSQLEKAKSVKNVQFIKAMDQFAKVLKTLPGDEDDLNG